MKSGKPSTSNVQTNRDGRLILPLEFRIQIRTWKTGTHPIKKCCRCLRTIGFGYTFISNRVPKDKRLVRKWTKDIPLTIKRRISRQIAKPGVKSKAELRAIEETQVNAFFRMISQAAEVERGNPLNAELERAGRRKRIPCQ